MRRGRLRHSLRIDHRPPRRSKFCRFRIRATCPAHLRAAIGGRRDPTKHHIRPECSRSLITACGQSSTEGLDEDERIAIEQSLCATETKHIENCADHFSSCIGILSAIGLCALVWRTQSRQSEQSAHAGTLHLCRYQGVWKKRFTRLSERLTLSVLRLCWAQKKRR